MLFFTYVMILSSENKLILTVAWGEAHIELLPNIAPQHVARMKELTRQGFFDGLAFHRADDRMVQTGDPDGTGLGGTGITLAAEFSDIAFERGIIASARMPDDPDSADSQIFIVRTPQPQMNGLFTAWGRVVQGMELSLIHI